MRKASPSRSTVATSCGDGRFPRGQYAPTEAADSAAVTRLADLVLSTLKLLDV
jgi:hypothetical protein